LAIIVSQKVTRVTSHPSYYLRQGGFVFASFCLSVCVWAR